MRRLIAILLFITITAAIPCPSYASITGEYITSSDRITVADIGKHPSGEFAVILTNDLNPGDRGIAVSSLRRKLAALGFLLDSGSEEYDTQVRSAVAAYENYLNIKNGKGTVKVDGVADTDLLEILYSSRDNFVTGELKPGKTGDEVKRMQNRLKNLGYLPGAPSGTYDANTRTAIRAFQYAQGIPETGFASVETLTLLYSADTTPTRYTACSSGDKGESVRTLQDLLRQQGFMEATESDGLFGQKTKNAVAGLQTYLRDRGIALGSYAMTKGTAEKDQQDTENTSGFAIWLPMDDIGIDMTVAPSADKTFSIGQGETIAWFNEDPYDININGAMDTLLRAYIENEDLLPPQDTYRLKDKGDDVTRIQRRLISLEYLFKGVDGIYGEDTAAAITKFQKRNGLEETGVCDRETLRALFSANAKKGMRTYLLEVKVSKQRVYAYTYDENDEYTILVRTMVCSSGTVANPTPFGTYTNTARGGRWHYFKEWDCWAQYAFYISGGIMFHSVLYAQQDESTLSRSSLNNLGRRASHGCIRLSVADAHWIWSNCESHTTVVVD